MRNSQQLFQLASNMKNMKPGVIVGYLNAIYKEGYKDGHAASCDELGLKDGDPVIVLDEDELKRLVKEDPSCESLLMRIYKEVNK